MDILDIDEVLKDDSFLCFEGKTHDDVVNILRQWKHSNNPPLLRGISNNEQKQQQQQQLDNATTIGEHRNYDEKINTRTFTRPKRKTFIALDVNTQHLQESILKPKIGGFVTPRALLQDISPPSSINVMTPLIHKSMLQDTSPPASICSSIDKSIDNSLITSADFSSISFLQTPNCYTLQDMISDRHKLEMLTLSSDDSTLLKDINIGQIDDISLQSKQTSSCSTMANSTDSIEATIIYANTKEQTFEVDTLQNNATFEVEQQQQEKGEEVEVEEEINVMEQTVCLSKNSESESPESDHEFGYSCKISTPLQSGLQKPKVELSPIDQTTPEKQTNNAYDYSSTPTRPVEDKIESQLQAHLMPHVYNTLTFSRLANKHKDNEMNGSRGSILTQTYTEEEVEQHLEDLEKTYLSKEEKRLKQPFSSLKKRLNVNSEEQIQSSPQHNISNERLLSRRSRLYDDFNLNESNSQENLCTSYIVNKTENISESNEQKEEEKMERSDRIDRRQQSRNRFKTIKLAKTRGENVPCIDDYDFDNVQEARVPQQQEHHFENNRQISKLYRKYEMKSNVNQYNIRNENGSGEILLDKKENLLMRPRNLKGLYAFSGEKANSAHDLDTAEALQRERSKSREKTSPLGLKSKSYTNLIKPELTIKSITNTFSTSKNDIPNNRNNQQVADNEQFLNAADNTFRVKPVSGIRAPCLVRPLQRPIVYNKSQPASGRGELQEPDATLCYGRSNGINTTKIQKNPVSGIPKPPSSRLPAAVKRSGLPRPTSTTRR